MPVPRVEKSRNHDQGLAEAGSLGAIFTRGFNIAAGINLFIMTAYYMIFMTGTLYVREVYGASLSTAGFSSSVMVVGCVIARFFAGNLLSVFGGRKILALGILSFTSSIYAFFWVDSLVLLFAQRLWTGISIGLTASATGTLAAVMVPQAQRGLGVSIFSMSTALAMAAGPCIGILLNELFPYDTVVHLSAATGLVSVLLFACLGPVPSLGQPSNSSRSLHSFIDIRVIPFGFVALLACLTYGCMQAFLAPFSLERGFVDAAVFYFPVYAGSMLAIRPFSGRALDRLGENVVFFPSLAVMALAYSMMAYSYSAFFLLLSSVLLGISLGNFASAGHAVSLKLVERTRFPQATATYFMFFDAGLGFGPYLFGHVVELAGYTGLFLSLALLSLAAGVLYWLVHGRRTRGAS